jgi:hypothetical protein
MSFTLDTLAQELGIDPATLQAKSDVVAKWNGYLSEADTKYIQATAAQKEAKEAVEKAARDQQAIDEQIKSFGMTEATVTELRASNAAMKAALEQAKQSGLNIDLSSIPDPKAAPVVDPVKTVDQLMRSNFANMGAALQVQTRYQAVFGKPFTDDPVKLIDEAAAARMPLAQYAEQKYKFAEETQRQSEAATQQKIQEGIDAGVKKYKEENPVTTGNPSLTRGAASKFPKIFKPRDAASAKEFRSLPPRERIAASVARAREAIGATE